MNEQLPVHVFQPAVPTSKQGVKVGTQVHVGVNHNNQTQANHCCVVLPTMVYLKLMDKLLLDNIVTNSNELSITWSKFTDTPKIKRKI